MSENDRAAQSLEHVRRAQVLEYWATELFQDIAIHLFDRFKTYQLMKDDTFIHRRDRVSNDIHLYLELSTNEYFHLKSYTRHMLSHESLVESGRIFLTAYRKPGIELIGGTHSLRQDWYKYDAGMVSKEILEQNCDIF